MKRIKDELQKHEVERLNTFRLNTLKQQVSRTYRYFLYDWDLSVALSPFFIVMVTDRLTDDIIKEFLWTMMFTL